MSSSLIQHSPPRSLKAAYVFCFKFTFPSTSILKNGGVKQLQNAEKVVTKEAFLNEPPTLLLH